MLTCYDTLNGEWSYGDESQKICFLELFTIVNSKNTGQLVCNNLMAARPSL